MSTKNLYKNKKDFERLSDALEAAGVKSYGRGKKVAEITEYSASRVSEMLSGKIPMTAKFKAIVCAKFHISEEFLNHGEGEMFTQFFKTSPSLAQEEHHEYHAKFNERDAIFEKAKEESSELSDADFYRIMAATFGAIEDIKKKTKGGL